MQFIVQFEDDQDRAPEIRAAHMPAHKAFLTAHSSEITDAGPLGTHDGAAFGGLWIIEAPDAARVEAIIAADPFWNAGLRKAVSIMQWNRIFTNGSFG